MDSVLLDDLDKGHPFGLDPQRDLMTLEQLGVSAGGVSSGTNVVVDMDDALRMLFKRELMMPVKFIAANGMHHTYFQKVRGVQKQVWANIAVMATKRAFKLTDENIINGVNSITELLLNVCVDGKREDPQQFSGVLELSGYEVKDHPLAYYQSEYKYKRQTFIQYHGDVKFAYLGKPFPQILKVGMEHGEPREAMYVMYLMMGLVVEEVLHYNPIVDGGAL